jgi:putative Ca2+/H+ antiporter (TMEM165/GDT1 family)
VRGTFGRDVDITEALRTFVAVFPAELPDKTMVATVVLVTRFRRPLAVWVGAAAAFTIHVTVAVIAGRLISTLPSRLVAILVTILFATGAVLLLRESDETDDLESELDGEVPAATTSWWRAAAASFGVVLLAEWGDLTQLVTAGLAANSDDPLMVGLGALAALWTVAALAAALGQTLAHKVPVRLLRRIAAGVFALLAMITLIEAIRG